MSNKVIKIVAIVLMLIVLTTIVSLPVQAGMTAASVDSKNMYASASDKSEASTTINNIMGSLITIIQVVGVGVAIIMLIVLAIKYISAAPGDKADIKKHAIVYVVGAIVLFAASGILQIIKGFASSNISAT